jgi:hypothetical protein
MPIGASTISFVARIKETARQAGNSSVVAQTLDARLSLVRQAARQRGKRLKSDRLSGPRKQLRGREQRLLTEQVRDATYDVRAPVAEPAVWPRSTGVSVVAAGSEAAEAFAEAGSGEAADSGAEAEAVAGPISG